MAAILVGADSTNQTAARALPKRCQPTKVLNPVGLGADRSQPANATPRVSLRQSAKRSWPHASCLIRVGTHPDTETQPRRKNVQQHRLLRRPPPGLHATQHPDSSLASSETQPRPMASEPPIRKRSVAPSSIVFYSGAMRRNGLGQSKSCGTLEDSMLSLSAPSALHRGSHAPSRVQGVDGGATRRLPSRSPASA